LRQEGHFLDFSKLQKMTKIDRIFGF
jgi:hypothetical protein